MKVLVNIVASEYQAYIDLSENYPIDILKVEINSVENLTLTLIVDSKVALIKLYELTYGEDTP